MSADYYDQQALRLRGLIAGAIAPYVGTYTFAGGQKVPAIATVKNLAQSYPPPGTAVEGLEAVLYFPSAYTAPVMDGYACEDEWVLHLKQHDASKSTLPAKDAVLAAVSDRAESVVRSDANPLRGIPEICRITFIVYSYLKV